MKHARNRRMTETEWLAATNPRSMLELLRSMACERKLRLVAVACCRELWPYIWNIHCRQAVETAEHHVDGVTTIAERQKDA